MFLYSIFSCFFSLKFYLLQNPVLALESFAAQAAASNCRSGCLSKLRRLIRLIYAEEIDASKPCVFAMVFVWRDPAESEPEMCGVFPDMKWKNLLPTLRAQEPSVSKSHNARGKGDQPTMATLTLVTFYFERHFKCLVQKSWKDI